MLSGPLISVVIPTRDRPDVLAERALPSALNQSSVNLEVIVVDDGSNRPVVGPVERVVRVIRTSAPRGVAAARNAGIAEARGVWIAVLDDDDLWSPDKLRTQLASIGRSGDFCYSSAIVLDDRGRPMKSISAPSPDGLAAALVRRNVVPAGSSNVLVRRSLLTEIGGFDETFSHLDDWDCWLRLADAGRPTACPDVHVAYIIHSASRVQRDAGIQHDELDRFETKHQELAARFDRSVDQQDFARFVAVAHRRAGRATNAGGVYLSSALRHRSPGDLARAGAALLRLPPRRQRRLSLPDWATVARE